MCIYDTRRVQKSLQWLYTFLLETLFFLTVLIFSTHHLICFANGENHLTLLSTCLAGVSLLSSVHSTQAVRITDDHYRHPECYTCTDCGLNLRMRGHFWAGDVMYCEKHAKERYQGPGSSPRATVSHRQWVTPHLLLLWTRSAAFLPETPPYLTHW